MPSNLFFSLRPSFRIGFIGLLVVALALPLAARTKNKVKKLAKEIEQSFDAFAPTGMAVAVVKDGEIVLQSTLGYKDAEAQSPITPNTLFSIASCSKAFTAACVGLLVAEGKLDWSDKVTDFVPGFQLADPCITSQMTVRDLLCHRSGLGTFFGDLLWYGTNYTNEEVIRRMRHLPINRQFRSEFGYQNNMYMVAGEIIREVSGKSWSEFVVERIFRPLGMQTTVPSNDELAPGQDLALGHIKGKKVPVYDFNATKPAASIYSSVNELSHWMRMLLDRGRWQGKEVLPAAVLADMFTAQVPQNVSAVWQSWGVHFRAYGLGWGMFDYAGKKVIEHNGGMPGYISKVCVVPEENLGVVILNNGMNGVVNDAVRFKVLDYFLEHTGEDWDKVFGRFVEMGEEYEAHATRERTGSRVKRTKMSLNPEDYVGIYTDKMYGDAAVEMRGKTLHLTLQPAAAVFTSPMEHWHYDTFKVQFKDDFLTFGLINFKLDAYGKISGFKIDLPSDDFHFFNLDFRKKQ
ncbi:MAG: serine hydrolase [Bacteroidota bacterium]